MHRRTGVDWSRVEDAAFSIVFWIACVFFVLVVGTVIFNWINGDARVNAIENSNQWAGYSEVEVYQIFDRKTGVMYAVTETGDICVIVDEDGKPRMVD